jgi:hypothetical protein
LKRNQTNKLKTWTDKLKEGESVTSIPKENIDSNKISFYNGDTSDSDSELINIQPLVRPTTQPEGSRKTKKN